MKQSDEEDTRKVAPVDSPSAVYATFVPTSAYSCGVCGAHGCKLWRQYQTFLEHQSFFCAACALRDQKKDGPVDKDGRRESSAGHTDQIGWLVPAVPTWDGSTFWGYASVPDAAVAWWRALPTSPSVSGRQAI